MLSLPPFERCVKFLDKSVPPPPAGAVAPAAAPSLALIVNKGASLVITYITYNTDHLLRPCRAHVLLPCPTHPSIHPTTPGRQLRSPADKFGRNITTIRHSLTEDDKRPLPTVQK